MVWTQNEISLSREKEGRSDTRVNLEDIVPHERNQHGRTSTVRSYRCTARKERASSRREKWSGGWWGGKRGWELPFGGYRSSAWYNERVGGYTAVVVMLGAAELGTSKWLKLYIYVAYIYHNLKNHPK